MTVINIDLRTVSDPDPEGITVTFMPTRRLSTGSYTILDDLIRVRLEGGEGTVDLIPTDSEIFGPEPWAWKVAEYRPNQDGVYKYVLVPDESIPVDYDALIEVDPESYQSEETPDPRWWARIMELEEALESGALQGPQGEQGEQGPQGPIGASGLSAYEIAVANGFIGTESEWLASLDGTDGVDGEPGPGLVFLGAIADFASLPTDLGLEDAGTAYMTQDDGRFWVWDGDSWIDGGIIRGPEGPQGPIGPSGLSAYEVAVADGFVGTESEWLLSLVGGSVFRIVAANDAPQVWKDNADYICDGVNDQIELQAAIDASQIDNLQIFLSPGEFWIEESLVVEESIVMVGSGQDTTWLRVGDDLDDYAIKFEQAGADGIVGARFADFGIDGRCVEQNTAGGGILANGAVECLFERLHIINPFDWGIVLGPMPSTAFGHHNRIMNCHMDATLTSAGNGGGVWMTSSDENWIIGSDFQFMGGTTAPVGTATVVVLDQAGLQTISNSTFVGGRNNSIHVRLHDTKMTQVIGCAFDGSSGDAIFATGSSHVIANNIITSPGDQGSVAASGIYLEFGATGISVLANSVESSVTDDKTRSLIRESADGAAGGNIFIGNTLKIVGTITQTPFELAGADSIAQSNIINPGAIHFPADSGGDVDSVNGQTGVVVLDHTDVGAAAAVHGHAIADVTGLQADLDDHEGRLDAIELELPDKSDVGHVHAAADVSSGILDIARLPVADSGESSATEVVRANDARLSDARLPTAHTHDADDLTSGGIPAGGTTGQVLTKDTATDYDVSWQTPSGGGGGDLVDLTVENFVEVVDDLTTPTKAYRLRTTGGNLDFDAGGADLFLSCFPNPDYTGTQRFYLRLESGAHVATPVGRWRFANNDQANDKIALIVDPDGPSIGFYGTAPQAKPTVTGAKGGNAALASLIDALEALGLITDTTT